MSNTIRANQLEEKELMMLVNSVPYDDRVNYNAKLSDLKPSLIQEFLADVESDLYQDSLSHSVEEIGTDMRIIGGPAELRKPLNVGLMFFNDKPDNFFPYARIEVVDKPDPTGEGMTEKIFTGPLNRQLKDALNYIKNYIIKEKMEITSLPGPDRTISDSDLKNYHLVSKRYRNRRIGDFLKELKLIEGRNFIMNFLLRKK